MIKTAAPEPTRYVHVLIQGRWHRMDFAELREGDIFRLFEAGGQEVDDGEISVALSDAFTTGVLSVKCGRAGRKK